FKPIPTVTPGRAGFTLEEWDKAGFWQRESCLLTHTGGGTSLAPFTPVAGTYSFTMLVVHGKRAEWVVAFQDEKNRIDCQLDSDRFTVTQYSGGKKVSNLKVPVQY